MNTHVPLRSILLATNLTDIEWLFPFTCSLAEESGAHVTLAARDSGDEWLYRGPCGLSVLRPARSDCGSTDADSG